jgi:hypothetical protein
MHPFSSWPLCTWSVHGAPPPHHHGVLPRRHSSAVWRRTRSRRGMGGSYCPAAAALARGWPRPAPGACPRRGIEQCHWRRRAGAGAGVVLADAGGSASSKGTVAGSTRARQSREGLAPFPPRSRPHILDPMFVRGPGVDGISFTVQGWTVNEIPSTLRPDPAAP